MSLKGGIQNPSQWRKEFLDTVEDVQKGKQGACERLYKYVEDGAISTKTYNELIEKYGIKREERKKRNTKALLIGLLLLVVCLFFILKAFAHSGRTDANGGHWNRSTGTYHYHSGENAGDISISSEYEEGIASDFLKNKAYERAKIIDEKYGEGAYGGTAYLDGTLDSYNKGYEEGYKYGYDKGYENGYKARIEEATSERKKEYRLLSYIGLGIIIIVLIVKFIKNRRKEKH